ncbi:MAG: outer membrane protein, partial [Xanthobacteraceae bacterium]
IGGGFENSTWTDPLSGASASFSDSGFLGGAQVGVNTQFNWFVVGVEGDFSWTSMIKGTSTDTAGNIMTTSPQWTSTVTGRVGAAFDRLLVYGKAGVALAEDESTFTPLGSAAITDDLTRVGWTAGGGLEYALTDNWALRAEYDYLGFGSKQLTFGGAGTTNANLNVQEVKAGFDYKFGP